MTESRRGDGAVGHGGVEVVRGLASGAAPFVRPADKCLRRSLCAVDVGPPCRADGDLEGLGVQERLFDGRRARDAWFARGGVVFWGSQCADVAQLADVPTSASDHC